MPLNLLKKYPELLDLSSYTEKDRTECLRKIYKRDIEDYLLFFRQSKVYPTKNENDETTFATHFGHLTGKNFTETNENGETIKKRSFDIFRSQRLHWIKTHIEEQTGEQDILVFSNDYPSVRTYIWNKKQSYVVILEPQRKPNSYYLLTAYYLNEKGSIKQMENKYQKRMSNVV